MIGLIYTSKNDASLNIAAAIAKKGVPSNAKLMDAETESVLDVLNGVRNEFNEYIVLSSHKSRVDQTTFTAHYPGNWGTADFGGADRTLNIANASRLKAIVQHIVKINDIRWDVVMEADHHGPTCSKPIMYVEIGSTEKEWKNKRAGEMAAEAILEGCTSTKKFENIIAFGTGHYPKEFHKMLIEGDVAVSHVMPKYRFDNLDETMFEQAVRKNVDTIKSAIIVKNSTNASQRKKISDLCSIFGVEYAEI